MGGTVSKTFKTYVYGDKGEKVPEDDYDEQNNDEFEEMDLPIKEVESIVGTDSFQKAIKNNQGVVIDCYADWCGPCQQIKPFYASLPKKYPQLRFFKVIIRNWEEGMIMNNRESETKTYNSCL